MKRALLVIDVQNDYFGEKFKVTYPENGFLNILKAIDAANEKGIPVILVQHTSAQAGAQLFVKDSEGWQIHDDIQKRGHLTVVEKFYPGSFTGTNLDVLLKENGIDTVVISGFMTQMCCDTTSRQASHLNYKVEFLSDATGTLDFTNEAGAIKAKELHETVLIIQAMGFSKVMSTENWVKSL
ncbi:MAG: cysteine hydrolase [Clostridia bacterium]|nr:cysteine hydrolase [Clostridia bacterium]